MKTSERPRLFCEPARPGRGNPWQGYGSCRGPLADALAALANLAPEADGVEERYERLRARLAGDPMFAASRTLRLALAVEFLDLAERLVVDM